MLLIFCHLDLSTSFLIVSCFTAAWLAAKSDAAFVSVNARTYVHISVCCRVFASVTELFDCCPLLLTTVNSMKMDYPSELYNESFDIGEESFQPDYNESDEESDSMSVVALSFGVPASEKGTSARKITIKKPSVERVPVPATTHRKRAWKSTSFQNDMVSSVSSTSSTVETAVEPTVDPTVDVSSLEETSMQPSSEPAVIAAACDPLSVLIADEDLVGDG